VVVVEHSADVGEQLDTGRFGAVSPEVVEGEGGDAGTLRPVGTGDIGDREERFPDVLGAVVELVGKIGPRVAKCGR
jgi:hypothetical protein